MNSAVKSKPAKRSSKRTSTLRMPNAAKAPAKRSRSRTSASVDTQRFASTLLPTNEELRHAIAKTVGAELAVEVFGPTDAQQDQHTDKISPQEMAERLSRFASKNPVLGRVWFFELLNSSLLDRDPLWIQLCSYCEEYPTLLGACSGIDAGKRAQTLLATILLPSLLIGFSSSRDGHAELMSRFIREVPHLNLSGYVE